MNKQRILKLIITLVIIPIGFYTKFYEGSYQQWVQNSLGGVFYVIFWCLMASIFFPRVKPIKLTTIVVVITCLLEFSQLIQNPFLDSIRHNFIIRTIIGNSFNWLDFPYYFVGGIFGYLILKINSTSFL